MKSAARRLSLVSTLAVAWACAASPAWAEGRDGALARALFHDARALVEAGEYARACPKFEESLALDPGIGTQFNLAHCWEQMGRTASAWTLYLDVAAAARAQGMSEREAAARARAEAVESSLMRLRIDVRTKSNELKVTLDGESLGPPSWGTAMPLDPGSHVVRAVAPGLEPWSRTVELAEPGQTLSVVVPELAARDQTPLPAPNAASHAEHAVSAATPAGPAPDAADGGTQRTWSWISAGAGIAALAVGVVFHADRQSSINEAKRLCTGGPNQNLCVRDRPMAGGAAWDEGAGEKKEWEALAADADRSQVVSYVGFGVGGAALLTAAILYVTASGDDDGRDRASLRPHVDAGVWGGNFSFSF